ncbi:glycerophosphodiester phosphodiesterase domain-containing protein [Kitasatospora sp. Ki12]|uniref:glycerophosphodiester phosphodiesterase n=1 Tax=Kitasatospora xanthocidica TaxID=83382 RepID=UPI001675ECD4|nr:glycerophosphodiester phosphodiesterase [Kitasatospora xanthocidica]GHF69937.1 glycerophosphoryl diester phosphodiesterase [Kitasatospora xanthocidica]
MHVFLDHPGPLAFAHRGGDLGHPENSLAAFEAAVALGYRYLETDVHATSDGVLVAFHDSRLDRVTDRAGAVAELPWESVRRARIGGSEPVPLLEDLLGAFPGARFNIDVKAAPAVAPLVEAIRRTDAWDRVCVGGFSDSRLAAVRAAAGPRLATSLGPREVARLRLRSLAGPLLRGRAAAPFAGVCAQVPERHRGVRVVDRAFVRTAHRLGLQVHVWTVDDPTRIRALLDLGVDGIMADRIDVLRDVLGERGCWTDGSTGSSTVMGTP